MEKPIEAQKDTQDFQSKLNNFDWKFQALDKGLSAMRYHAIDYLKKLHKGEYTFLSILGPTERGKTLLMNDIRRFISENSRFFKFPYAKKTVEGRCEKLIIYGTLKELVSECLGDNKRLKEIKGCGILFIEEFFNFNVINAYNNMIIEIAFDIINSRKEMAVVLDSNKRENEISDIDVRIESRLHRNGGVVLDISDKIPMFLKRTQNGNNTKR